MVGLPAIENNDFFRQPIAFGISESKRFIPELEWRPAPVKETCHFSYAAALHLNKKVRKVGFA